MGARVGGKTRLVFCSFTLRRLFVSFLFSIFSDLQRVRPPQRKDSGSRHSGHRHGLRSAGAFVGRYGPRALAAVQASCREPHLVMRLCADADCLKNLLPKGGETVQLTYCASYTYLRSSSLFYSGRHVYISNMSQPPEPELSLPFDYIIFVYSSEWAVPCVEVRGARCPKACLELAPSPTLRTNLLSLVSGRLNFPLLVLLTF